MPPIDSSLPYNWTQKFGGSTHRDAYKQHTNLTYMLVGEKEGIMVSIPTILFIWYLIC